MEPCTCAATTPGRLCAACVQRGNSGWPTGPKKSGPRSHLLSNAARSRIASSEGQADFFGIELSEAQRTTARARDSRSERYEVMKGDVRRKAKNPAQYELRIKAAVKRIRY
jgi:hypothetical protein